jgi:hypothetical protein
MSARLHTLCACKQLQQAICDMHDVPLLRHAVINQMCLCALCAVTAMLPEGAVLLSVTGPPMRKAG